MTTQDDHEQDTPDLAEFLPAGDIDLFRAAFDSQFYLDRYQDVQDTGLDPVMHYLRDGWKEGRDPCPIFSTSFYLEDNPDVAAAGVNPFWHYLVDGRAEGRAPLPPAPELETFDPEQLAEVAAIRGDFDALYYSRTYPEAVREGRDPLIHYMLEGWRAGHDPSPAFSTSFYLEDNPDVAAAGVNPFWHYLVSGHAEGRQPLPPSPELAMLNDAQMAERDMMRDHFDAEFYLASYPEVARAGRDPLIHYMLEGWPAGHDPSQSFSTRFYLEDNPDVADAGMNPFWHYLVVGQREGRQPLPPQPGEPKPVASADAAPKMDPEYEIEGIREHFDAEFYLDKYPDVAEAGADPLQHFVEYGRREGRDPNSEFSTSAYLTSNPDIVAFGFNPFWHYCVAGRAEGRKPRHPGGYKVLQLFDQLPLEKTVARWTKRSAAPQDLLSAEAIGTALRAAAAPGRDWLILSVGHDDYRVNPGGIQVCIQREQHLAAANGAVYLNLHPAQPLPRLAHEAADPDPAVVLVLDGRDLGRARISALTEATAALDHGRPTGFGRVDVIVHQFLGHLPERIAELVQATVRPQGAAPARGRCWLWLHDYLTICPGFTLQRNNIAYCGAPPERSNACGICLYGRERPDHGARIRAFFDALDVHVLSPSQVTADLWTEKSGLTPASLQVCPHMTLDWRPRAQPLPEETGQITVGFLGTPVPFKGWTIFERMIERHKLGTQMRFVYCGARPVKLAGVDKVPVHVTTDNPDAMIDTVRAEKIDLVLHWATWPETFSLSCYEALAGGAYVLTNPVSGNVAATIDRLGCGAVLEDEDALVAFFEDGRAADMVQELRRRRAAHSIHHSLSQISFSAQEGTS